MKILIDIEWIQENDVLYITQFAALRVSDDWNTVDEFERLVRPAMWRDTDWEHMAYAGYSPDEFCGGVDENTCISDFMQFIRDGDSILCWHKDTKRLLNQKIRLYIEKPFPIKSECVNHTVYAMANARGVTAHGLYETAEGLGITTPSPQHRSVNDVLVMQGLLSVLEYGVKPVPTIGAEAPKKTKSRAERNADILSRAQYNFIFSPDSTVFHRSSCHLMRNARALHGCVYYETAAKMREPCKVCRPKPIEHKKQKKAAIVSEKAVSPRIPEKKIISAKLLGDRWIEITNTKLVGVCHNMIHPGKLTRKIMEEHDCLGKNCRFFEKYEDSSYWVAEKNRTIQKEKRKQAQQIKKETAQKLQDELDELRILFQSYADDAEYEMMIVRLEKVHPTRYRVFYVSNHPFADGNRFPDFLASIKYFFPRYSIQLRHIKDVDGHFVTISEYLSRKK